MRNQQAPKEWYAVQIADISIKGQQRKPNSDESFTYIDIGSIDRDSKRISTPQRLKGEDAPSRARKVINSGDVLVSLTRPNLNAVALVTEKYDDQIASTGFEVIKPINVESRYIFALTRSKDFIDTISGVTQGALYPAAKSADVQAYTFLLPPLAEQKVIAEKLDTLLAQVEATKARLESTLQTLKQFRQSVLAAAVSGKLTEDWRAENPSLDSIELSEVGAYWSEQYKISGKRLPKLKLHETEALDGLPDTWLDTKIGHVFDVHVGATPSRSNHDYWDGGIHWVSSSEVAFCRISSTKETITESGLNNTSTNLHPPGTVMLAMIGQGKTRGQVAILDIEACHNQNTAALRVPKGFSVSEFLYFFLAKQYEETRRVGGGNNQKALNKSFVQSLPFPLPPLEEQQEIVNRVEKLFAGADASEQQVNQALERVNNLTQSILAKAFRGELTEQWRKDNPELISGENSAEALLEKIKTDRAAAKPKRKTRKKAE